MEKGCGIYRTGAGDAGDLRQARGTEAAIPRRHARGQVRASGTPTGCPRSSSAISSTSPRRWRMSALARKESRGAHQRIDGFEERDDVQFPRPQPRPLPRGRGARDHLRAGEDHQVAAGAARLRRAWRSARSRKRMRPMPEAAIAAKTVELEILRYRPGHGRAAVVRLVPGAIHRRHVGAAGAADHQGRAGRYAVASAGPAAWRCAEAAA